MYRCWINPTKLISSLCVPDIPRPHTERAQVSSLSRHCCTTQALHRQLPSHPSWPVAHRVRISGATRLEEQPHRRAACQSNVHGCTAIISSTHSGLEAFAPTATTYKRRSLLNLAQQARLYLAAVHRRTQTSNKTDYYLLSINALQGQAAGMQVLGLRVE
jgi:hypothetical protein